MYLMGLQSREALEAVSRLGRRAILSLAHQGQAPVDFSTGSVGLGVGVTLFASLVQDYLRGASTCSADRPGA